jgi:hypothetical protein
VRRVTWEERLLELFDDLEQQAEGLALLARDAEVSQRARDHYTEIDLASRLHASVGTEVDLVVPGAGPITGRLLRVGNAWCLVEPADARGQEVIVNLAGLLSARRLAVRAAPEPVRGIVARLGIASALRGAAAASDAVVVVRVDGEVRRGRLGRVGSDFVELVGETGTAEAVPMTAVSVVRRV